MVIVAAVGESERIPQGPWTIIKSFAFKFGKWEIGTDEKNEKKSPLFC